MDLADTIWNQTKHPTVALVELERVNCGLRRAIVKSGPSSPFSLRNCPQIPGFPQIVSARYEVPAIVWGGHCLGVEQCELYKRERAVFSSLPSLVLTAPFPLISPELQNYSSSPSRSSSKSLWKLTPQLRIYKLQNNSPSSKCLWNFFGAFNTIRILPQFFGLATQIYRRDLTTLFVEILWDW